MYAVIETGGKQYRVSPGDIIQVEKLPGEVGSSVRFENILLLSRPGEASSQVWLGQPYVSQALVEAEVVGQGRGDKIIVFKKKRRKGYRKTQGHRQEQTQLLVLTVDSGSGVKATLGDQERKNKLARFSTPLKPKGLGHTPRTLGSRVRLKAKENTTSKAASTKAPSEAKKVSIQPKATKAPARKKST